MFQRLLRRFAYERPQLGLVCDAACRRFFARDARHRQHCSLGGLHHGFIGVLHTHFQRVDQVRRVRRALALQCLGKAPEQQAGDYA